MLVNELIQKKVLEKAPFSKQKGDETMNVLLLGNGFDLHYNLPTKYIYFLNVTDYLTRIDVRDP